MNSRRLFPSRAVLALVSALTLLATAGAPSGVLAQQPAQLVPVAPVISSPAYESARVLKAGSGTLLFLCGYNSGPAQFIQLYNAVAVPGGAGTVPVVTFTVPSGGNFSLDVPLSGMPFTVGIVVGNSSTGPSRTAGASDCFFTAVIR